MEKASLSTRQRIDKEQAKAFKKEEREQKAFEKEENPAAPGKS